jgi:hypothetical protein
MPSQSVASKPVAFVLLPLLALLALLASPARSLAAPTEVENLSIAPAPALLPPTTVGEQSPNTAFKLKNEAPGSVNLMGLQIVGGSAGSFIDGGGTCKNTTLAPGEECTVSLGFKPEATGPVQAALEVTFMGGDIQNFTIGGLGVEPEIAFLQAEEDFGLVRLFEQENRSIQLVNVGPAPIHPSGSSIEGSGAVGFSYEFSGCQGALLNPGDSCSIPIRFEPQVRATYEATLKASVGSVTATTSLKGRGGGPILELVGSPPGFGPATVGAAGSVRTVTIANSGDLPAGFFIGIVSGGDSGSFQLLSENCTGPDHRLEPGSTCSAEVRFRPLSAGAKSATLAFFGEGDSPAMIPIDGTGVEAAASLSSGDLGFGPQASGSRSAPLSVSVRNGGLEPIETGQIAIVGADLDQFALAGDECTGVTLAPGAECVIRVRFAPDGVGAKSAKLRVAIPGGALTANLAGTATPAPDPAPIASPAAPAASKKAKGGKAGAGAKKGKDAKKGKSAKKPKKHGGKDRRGNHGGHRNR